MKQKLRKDFLNYRTKDVENSMLMRKTDPCQKALNTYYEKRAQIPDEICTCCNRYWFRSSIREFKSDSLMNQFNEARIKSNLETFSKNDFLKKVNCNKSTSKLCNSYTNIIPILFTKRKYPNFCY